MGLNVRKSCYVTYIEEQLNVNVKVNKLVGGKAY